MTKFCLNDMWENCFCTVAAAYNLSIHVMYCTEKSILLDSSMGNTWEICQAITPLFKSLLSTFRSNS